MKQEAAEDWFFFDGAARSVKGHLPLLWGKGKTARPFIVYIVSKETSAVRMLARIYMLLLLFMFPSFFAAHALPPLGSSKFLIFCQERSQTRREATTLGMQLVS